jgi:hypothetical protein
MPAKKCGYDSKPCDQPTPRARGVAADRPRRSVMMAHAVPADRVLARIVVATTLLAGFAYLAYGMWATMLPLDGNLRVRLGHPAWAGHDAIVFLGAARLIEAGEFVASYDPARLREIYRGILGGVAPPIPWSYPPVLAPFVAPLAWVSPVSALALYFAVMFGAAVALARLIAGRWAIGVAALGFPCVVHSLVVGQNGTLTALLLGCGLAFWRRAPWAAGVAFGLLAYKPHFLVLPLLLAFALGNRQAPAAMIATVSALVCWSIALYGIEAWLAWLQASSRQFSYLVSGELPAARVVTAFGLVFHLTGNVAVALALHGLTAAAAICGVIALWRRSEDDFMRAVTLAAGSVVVTPYAFDYDLAVLAVPLAALLGRAARPYAFARAELRWFVLLGFGPFATATLSLALDWPFGAVSPALALIAACACLYQRPAGVGAALVRA